MLTNMLSVANVFDNQVNGNRTCHRVPSLVAVRFFCRRNLLLTSSKFGYLALVNSR